MSTKSIVITTRVPGEWEPRLLALCAERGIDPDPPKGRAGGFSLLIRQLLAEQVGGEVIDPHQVQSERFAEARLEQN